MEHAKHCLVDQNIGGCYQCLKSHTQSFCHLTGSCRNDSVGLYRDAIRLGIRRGRKIRCSSTNYIFSAGAQTCSSPLILFQLTFAVITFLFLFIFQPFNFHYLYRLLCYTYQLSPRASTFLLISTEIFPKELSKGIDGGENAPDADHFLPLSLSSNVGNELRPASPFHAILQFRHRDAPFLPAAALPSAFVSIRCIMYSEPQTRHISFSSTATACAVVALAFVQVERGFGTIFEQLCVYIYQKIYGMFVRWGYDEKNWWLRYG